MGSVHAFQIGCGLVDHRPCPFSRAAAPKKRGKRGLAAVFNQSGLLCSRRRCSSRNAAGNWGASC